MTLQSRLPIIRSTMEFRVSFNIAYRRRRKYDVFLCIRSLFIIAILSLATGVSSEIEKESQQIWINSTMSLGLTPPLSSPLTIEEMISREAIRYDVMSCLDNTDHPTNNQNRLYKSKDNTNFSTNIADIVTVEVKNLRGVTVRTAGLSGTTYWINEFMAVGHVSYDLALLQLLKSFRIDRIVLQRAPCATKDLCQGLGTWESFYKGLYTIMLAAAGKSGQVPVYVRMQKSQEYWIPYYLGNETRLAMIHDMFNHFKGNYANEKTSKQTILEDGMLAPLKISNMICFERLLRRKYNTKSFHHAIDADTARAFKRAAYEYVQTQKSGNANKMTSDKAAGWGSSPSSSGSISKNDSPSQTFGFPLPLQPRLSKGHPLIVTIAHRGNSHRSMQDPQGLARSISEHLNKVFASNDTHHTTAMQAWSNSAPSSSSSSSSSSSTSTIIPSPIPSLQVQLFDTSEKNLLASQIHIAHASQVIVATHGGFETNLIFMRENALLLELLGPINGNPNRQLHVESANYRRLSQLFLVHHREYIVQNLQTHNQPKYTIDQGEMNQIASIISDYLKFYISTNISNS